MRRQSLLLITLAVTLIVAGCATGPPPYNPFKVAQDEIYRKVKRVALAPFTVDIADPEPVKAKFESILEAKLREAGFMVVPSKEAGGIWKQMTEQVGGFFDPLTGKRDEAKFKTVREHALRELRTKFQSDALLSASIVPVKASWSGTTATWDGTTESIRSTWEAILLGPSYGTVAALSFLVIIEDMNQVDMYVNRGGIELLAKVSGGQFVGVPRNELFANEERNVAAVNIALGPLVTKPKSSEAKP